MLNQTTRAWCALLILFFTSTPLYAENNQTFINNWREDIDYLHQQLEGRHIDLYHRISKSEFIHELTQLKQGLPTMDQSQITLGLMALVKKIGDGHTQFAYWGSTHHRFPIQLHVSNNKIYLVGISPKHQRLLGMELISIDNTPIQKVIDLITPLLQSVENPYSQMQRLAETIPVSEMLFGLRIIQNPTQTTLMFADTNGVKNFATLSAEKTPALIELKAKPPAGFKKYRTKLAGVDLFLNSTHRVALINFKAYPHHGMSEFASELPDIFSDHKIQKVIIDLRRNGGGNFLSD